jgi:hypothetical protein
MSIELKVKVKSLAAEAKIIRLEERRASTPEARASLHQHRVGIVRLAARNTLLAYGYLRGRSYRQIEASCKRPPDWSAVEKMVMKYGPPSHNVSFEDWRKNEQIESLRRTATGS